MGSIRPLFTITVLVVVGAYLYVKINEGPTHSHGGAHENQLADGVPPLAAAGGGATLAQDSAAPAWPPAQSSAPPSMNAPVSATSMSAGADAAKNSLPEVPPIPDFPALPATADVTPPATKPAAPPTATSLPTELPKDIPTAQYPDASGPSLGLGAAKDGANSAPPVQMNPAGSAPTPPANSATTLITPTSSSPLPSTSNQPLPPLGSAGLNSPQPTSPQAANQNPLRPATGAAPEPDRYGASQTPATQTAIGSPLPSQPSAPVAQSFATSWPTIQAALDRGDLKQAHQMLSKWHADDSLAPAEAQKVETLLSQLAGTVIYSTEHKLEPARVVKPGETLESIAKEYNVPWQLLAKINGIPAADQLRPGQQLKVVRGPFSAVVDLRHNELALEVDGCYAGKFAVIVPPGTALTDGQWLVDQKLGGAQPAITPTAYGAAPAATERSIILRSAANPGSLAGGPTLIIASGAAPTGPGAGATAIRIAPQDAEEISDILSVGSRVVVRR